MDLRTLKKDERIGIYGTGKNAKRVLETLQQQNVIGFISEHTESAYFAGKRIYQIGEIVKKVDSIIIAAMPKSAVIIYNRIINSIPSGVTLYDMSGRCLNGIDSHFDESYWDTSYLKLLSAIKTHETIIIDIFASLLAGSFYKKEDVWALIEKELVNDGLSIPFCEWRTCIEKMLIDRGNDGDIDAIYQSLEKEYAVSLEVVSACKAKEEEIFSKCFCPRKKILEAISYAKSNKKRIVFVSNAYFSRPCVINLLKNLDLDLYDELYILSEIPIEKNKNEKYKYIINKEGYKSLLIHSNATLSVRSDSFFVMSVQEMLEISSLVFLVEKTRNYTDRMVLGYIIARIYNDPFVLNATSGKYIFSSAKVFGYTCVAPIVLCYVIWIIEQVREKDTAVLFASRDGYFLKKVYDFFGKKISLPTSIYFYTSRMAATISSLNTVHDIEKLCSKASDYAKFNLQAYVEYRFGIKCSNLPDCSVGSILKKYGQQKMLSMILKHKEEIFVNSAMQRENYLAYIEALKLNGFDKLILVDLVTQGTTYNALIKFWRTDLYLFALALHGKIKTNTKAQACLANLADDDMRRYLFLMLELCLSSREGQLQKIERDKKLKFVPASEYDGELLSSIQDGISEMLRALDKLGVDFLACPLSKEFAMATLSTIFWKNSYFKKALVDRFTLFDFDTRYNSLEYAGCEIID